MYEFKKLSGTTKYLSYKEWKANDYVVGKVERFKQNTKNPKVQDVVVTIIDSNIKTPKLTLAKNDPFTINGTTALQKAIEGGVEEGDILKVVYKGKETIKTGPYKGSLANSLDVFVAPAQDADKFTNVESTEDDGL